MSYLVCRHPEASSWAVLLSSQSRPRFAGFIDYLSIERANAIGIEFRSEPAFAFSSICSKSGFIKPAGKASRHSRWLSLT